MPRRSFVLGAVLLLGSAITVLASVNTPPTITSATVMPSTLNEGQTVILNAAFTDPDASDAHTVEIQWDDGTKDKIQLPIGQFSLQAAHTYVDNTPHSHIWLTVYDRQSPVGAPQNDNSEGSGHDNQPVTVHVTNVAPAFLRDVAVQKSPRNPRAVTVTGSFSDPGAADTHEVRVSWGIEANPFVPIHPCAITNKHFTCTYTYANTFSGGYTIRLRVKDDDGDVDNATLHIQLP
jgi:hypothetical protein